MTKPDKLAEMQLGKLSRQGEFVLRARDAEAVDDRVRELSFASEEPYERYWGVEILDHSPGAGDLSRLNNAGPLLLFHDPTKPIGVIEKAWMDKESRRSRALVRFGRSVAASEALRDVDDGILTHVSFAYWPLKMVLEEEEKGKPPVYLVTKWQALEVSLVTVAADDTVGVGRSLEDGDLITVQVERRGLMDPQNIETKAAPMAPAPVQVDVKVERDEAVKSERSRVKMINAHCEVAQAVFTNARQLADTFVSEGRSYQEYVEQLPTLGQRKASAGLPATLDLGRDGNERMKRYNLFGMFRSFGRNASADDCGFERELSAELVRISGRSPSDNGFFMPLDVLARTMGSGQATAGQTLVPTDHLGAEFIPFLRRRSQCVAAGARVMMDLKGKVVIPSFTAGHAASWVAEGTAPAKSTPTVGQVALDAKTVTVNTEVTELLLHQSSPDAQTIVLEDLFGCIGEAFDRAALHGTAADDQPRGIALTSGIGSAIGGTTGGAPTLTHLLKLRRDVAAQSADFGALAFMTNPDVQMKLMQTPVIASTDSRMVWNTEKPNELIGYRAFVTPQVRNDLTKSSGTNLSAIFYGNWSDLLMALWGGVEFVVDPFTLSTAAKTRITGRLFCDIAVRRAVSFAVMLDASTA